MSLAPGFRVSVRRTTQQPRRGDSSKRSISMPSRTCGVSLVALLALVFLAGCNNALNPLCGSSRPAPLIGSLSPSTMSFAQVQQGSVLIVNGSQFVSSSEVVIIAKALSTTVASGQQLKVTLTTAEISGPGPVNVTVHTPIRNSDNLR